MVRRRILREGNKERRGGRAERERKREGKREGGRKGEKRRERKEKERRQGERREGAGGRDRDGERGWRGALATRGAGLAQERGGGICGTRECVMW